MAIGLSNSTHDNSYALSSFTADVVRYIGGYIAQTVSKKVACDGCLDIMIEDNVTSILIFITNNGGLIMP